MNDEELAALSVAMQVLARPSTTLRSAQDDRVVSRWKIAARRPELEMEELRALY